MKLAHPELLFLLVLLPLVALAGAWVFSRRLRATSSFAARGLWRSLLPGHQARRPLVSVLLLAAAAALAGLALTQPRWGESEQKIERHGVDVVFVLDTSLSMATTDLPPNRLWVAQTLVRRLVQSLPGHRVALVQAEGDGVVMVPLTADSAVIDLVLDAVLPGSLPTPGTELAPALERALKLFAEGTDKHNVIVLLSDGEDHGAGVDPMVAKLGERGITVHTVGVGTLEGKPLEVPQPEPGMPVSYKRDQSGNVVVSKLVEKNLEDLAKKTGGVYLRATSAATDPRPIVDKINAMEQKSFGAEVVSTLEERFQCPLALAIFCLAAHLLIGPFRAEAAS
jgi:Ca-activated chloride channel family protein